MDSLRAEPGLALRIDWEVTRPASRSCGSLHESGRRDDRNPPGVCNPAH